MVCQQCSIQYIALKMILLTHSTIYQFQTTEFERKYQQINAPKTLIHREWARINLLKLLETLEGGFKLTIGVLSDLRHFLSLLTLDYKLFCLKLGLLG